MREHSCSESFRHSLAIVVVLCLGSLTGQWAIGQVLKGEAAYGSWYDDKPGVRRLLTPQDLPPIAKPTYALAQVVPIPTGALPQVSDGFSVQLVASALREPRGIHVAPNGDLFVADTMFNAVHVLRVPAGSAKPIRDEISCERTEAALRDCVLGLASDSCRKWRFEVAAGMQSVRYRRAVPVESGLR